MSQKPMLQAFAAFWGGEYLARRYGKRLLAVMATFGVAAGVGVGALAALFQTGIILPVVDFPVADTRGGTSLVAPRTAGAEPSSSGKTGGSPASRDKLDRDFFIPAVSEGLVRHSQTGPIPRTAAPPAKKAVPVPVKKSSTRTGVPAQTVPPNQIATPPPSATVPARPEAATSSAAFGPSAVPGPSAASAQAVEAAPSLPKGLSLRGIAVMGAKRAAILSVGSASDAYVAGEEVADGWKVKSISATAVTFAKEGHTVVLEWKGD